jgi:outer membrane protein assembly factor BamB
VKEEVVSVTQSEEKAPRKPLRLWPGVLLGALLVLFKLVFPFFGPGSPPIAMLGGLIGGLAIVLWWLFFSRAPWSERLGAVGLIAAGLLVTSRFVHPSIGSAGNGMLLPILALPIIALVLIAWAAASRGLADRPRRASMVATLLLACGAWGLVRTDGIRGGGSADLRWRWAPTSEERLLATADEPAPLPSATPSAPPPTQSAGQASPAPAGSEPTAVAPAPAAPAREADWPGFRGPRRDGVVRGAQIATDWATSPPVLMWRRPIGPGWSSFAVDGNLVYTQEQRGQDEIVSCYSLATGKPVWRHRDAARFWESVGGAGPRATPTLSAGRVYALGATGILNALDARTGAVSWTRNAASDSKTKNPGWGFSGSPLVLGDLVIVATSGTLVAYDAATGTPRWYGPKRRGDYSSPHLATIDGVTQVLLLTGGGATSVAPADGKVLWEHELTAGSRIIQPAFTPDGDVLATNGEFGDGNGIRRIALTRGPSGWTSQERWTSSGLKPTFNDFVVHEGHAYGFDGSILASLDLADGTRKWKGGRYGNGQLVLLPEQDLLLVVSEDGELALVRATPDTFTELARFKAIEGKTWNHPVLVRDVLLVRNGEEMAAFRLAPATPAEARGGASQ